MIHERVDIAILGAGFAGSLMALVLRQIGRQPVLLEKGTHPRFAIGESSTPLANLALETLCRTYDLPKLLPLTKYGRWQQAYPHLGCGLKRGFTFMQHERGQPFRPTPDHASELLVAASPADEIGDTHWFRADVDHFLVQQVQAAGIPYFDRTDISITEEKGRWHLRGNRGDENLDIVADLVIDATGPAGALSRAFNIQTDPAEVHTNSWTVYSHFTGVERWEDLNKNLGGRTADHPYHCDDAALHHVLADGWIWVLRFNNGITSAGVAFDGERHPPDATMAPEAVWQQILQDYPSIGQQFARAEAVQPWVRTGRLQRRARRAAGPNWVLLPHAAYFLDALFSGGIAHSMLGIERLAYIFERHRHLGERTELLRNYEQALFRETEFLDRLIHGCYRTFGRFGLLAAYTMYYFVGAHQSETHRRLGTGNCASGFLFSDHLPLWAAVRESHDALVRLPPAGRPSPEYIAEFQRTVARHIASYNPVGFCDLAKKNMYPFV
jgi:FADH2 O2-dependent halogenase